jgi:hypothetical protein
MTTKRGKIAVLVAALGLVGAACTLQRPEANQFGCTFGKGAFDTKALKGRYGPGQDGTWTNDDFKTGAADVRFYFVDSDPNTADLGGRPIVVPARGSSTAGVGVVEVSVEVQARFVHNELFCDWYIDHGKRNEPLNYDAGPDDESGWAAFLNASFNQKLIEAARPIVAPIDYISLFVNAPTESGELIYDALGDALSRNLTRELRADLGDDYFCGPSYVFDGEFDGEFDCPPIEITVKRIVPTDPQFVQKLNDIVANEEQQKVIESDKERALIEIAAQQQTAVRQSESDEKTQVAAAEAREAVQVAQAQADLEVAKEQAEVFAQRLVNEQLQAEADAAFCAQLAEQGTRCDLYLAAEQGVYPRIVIGESSDSTLLLDVGTP